MESHTTAPKRLAVSIVEASAPGDFDAAQTLFSEYINSLRTFPDIHLHHGMRDTDVELMQLENGKYNHHEGGAILLAKMQEEYVGAVALRRLTTTICEMKRLYVRPQRRGSAAGFQLVSNIMQKAWHLGYLKMRLDTLPGMQKAHQLYFSLGFYAIPKYNDNEVPGSLFMEADLRMITNGQ